MKFIQHQMLEAGRRWRDEPEPKSDCKTLGAAGVSDRTEGFPTRRAMYEKGYRRKCKTGKILPDMRGGPSPSTLLPANGIAHPVTQGTMPTHTPVGTVIEQNLDAH
jgi:hypothetical protein